MSEFWQEAIIPIYFVYGLAFYSMGLALLIESGRSSGLHLARAFRFLAGFGLLHGVHEWLDMLDQILGFYYDTTIPDSLAWFRLSLLIASFLALMAFAEMLRQLEKNEKTYRVISFLLIGYVVVAISARWILDIDDRTWICTSCNLARYILGVPASVMACIALWHQRTVFQERGMQVFVQDLTLASVTMAIYGVIGQVVVQNMDFFPANVINDDLFLDIFGFPIQVIRAMLALVVTFSIIRVLRALEVETQQRLQAMEEAKQNVEEQTREQLKALNTELRAINAEKERLLVEVRKRDALRGMLIKRITGAQEAERQRIARELHDETGQALTGLSMGLRGIAKKLEKDGNVNEVDYLRKLEKSATLALGELRGLISDLRPPQLDDMGLTVALRWLVNRCSENFDVTVEYEVHGEAQNLPPEIETTLFRIVQEGLNNIIKHSHAHRAGVELTYSNQLKLKIWDDGKGFILAEVLEPHTARTAWGLLGMQERASLIDAHLHLESVPGQGTVLTLTLDLVPEKVGL